MMRWHQFHSVYMYGEHTLEQDIQVQRHIGSCVTSREWILFDLVFHTAIESLQLQLNISTFHGAAHTVF